MEKARFTKICYTCGNRISSAADKCQFCLTELNWCGTDVKKIPNYQPILVKDVVDYLKNFFSK